MRDDAGDSLVTLRLAVAGALTLALLGCGGAKEQARPDAAGAAGEGGGLDAGGAAGHANGGGQGGAAGVAGGAAGSGGGAPAGAGGGGQGGDGRGGQGGDGRGGQGGDGRGGQGGDGRGGSAAGGGGAAGSLNPGAREPRVLIVDRATDRFATYGRDGQLAHDYRAELDFGAAFAARNAWVDGRLLSWDGPTNVAPARLAPPPPGLYRPVVGSRILLRSENSGTGQVKVKVLTVAGTVENAFTIAGAWSAFQLSPGRQFVYATTRQPASDAESAAVLRPADGTILWQKTVSYALFGGSDARLVFIPSDLSSPVRIKNLATGDEIAPALTQEPFASEPNIQINLEAGLNQLAIMKASGALLQSRLLYALDWLGKITRFGTVPPPRYTDDYLQAVDLAGNRALWSQQTNGLDGTPSTFVGTYEMVFAGPIVRTWDGIDAACFGRTTEKRFNLMGTSLQSCNCGDGACTTIATVPGMGAGWSTQLVTNPDRRTVVVHTQWPGSSLPASYPDLRCYSASGQLLATLPYGTFELDDTGQIVLLGGTRDAAHAGQRAIVDLASGAIHWLGVAQSATIVYE